MERITATAARKAAKRLGGDHPAVIKWRRIASGRVARINNADSDPRRIGIVGDYALENAKRDLVMAEQSA